jgi:signal transduction histidine kinase
MAREHQLGETIADYDQILDRSLERVKGMRTLILDLLDLTKLESGKNRRELKEVDIVSIAKMAIDTMRPISIQRDIKVQLHGPGNLIICADPDEMEIIFNNLISNGIKYNREGGSLDCTMEELDGSITISVEDTGIGMTQLEIEKLFQDFVRIRNEKTKNIAGSGLGLSIIKKLTESYNGKIEVTSTPDLGSKFVVTIPNQKPCT